MDAADQEPQAAVLVVLWLDPVPKGVLERRRQLFVLAGPAAGSQLGFGIHGPVQLVGLLFDLGFDFRDPLDLCLYIESQSLLGS